MELDFADVLLEVVNRRASDLHITAGTPPMIRTRGRLTPIEGLPALSPTDTREIIYSILTNSQRQRLENDWQLDFAYQIPGVARFRVNTYFQRSSLGAAFRLIPFEVVPLETLGLPPAVADFANRPRGLVLVTGPTGSGKSTTLASLIDVINTTREEHIMTIEDPIEFLHRHKKCVVNQRELGSDATSFGAALKAALRQDPDVILVGEMRDIETIGTAITAAETGHLVFATLHTQDTAQTIDRIIDVFPPGQQGQVRAQLSIALQGIMTQTLLPTADGSGRVVAAEVLVPTPAVRNLIREAKTHQVYSVLQTGGAHGMQTMDASLVSLVRSGKITRQMAEARAHFPEELRRLLGSTGAAPAMAMAWAMATFVFKAMDLAGVPAHGEVEAASKQDVAEQLKDRGLIVVDIANKYRSKELNLELFARVSAKDLAVASRQLSTMVTSGMSILRALYVLETQTDSKLLKTTIVSVRQDVEAGLLLSDALERHPKVFSSLYVSMVRAGETGGVLEECLLRVADQLEKDAALKRQVRAAMIYPSLVIFFAVTVMLALVAFLIPVFEGVFKQFPGKLPALSQFMVNFSHLLTKQWYLMIIVFAGIVIGFVSLKRSKWGRPRWDAFKLRVPMKIGDVVQKVAIARWSRTLASLSHAGVPILQAIDITGKTTGSLVVEAAMDDVITSIKSGGTISEPLRKAPVFPAMVSHMVGVGEETGALDEMLSKIADFYDSEVEAAVKALTSIMEPVMIILVGGIVGVIVISMYMPLFTVYNSIK